MRIIRKIILWIKHRTINKYHIVNTRLKPGYHDYDTRLLHSSFSLLEEYVEEIGGIKGIESKIDNLYKYWEADSDDVKFDYRASIDVYKEIKRLYIWWTQTYVEYDDRDPYLLNFDTLYPKEYYPNGMGDIITSVYKEPIQIPDELKKFKHDIISQSHAYVDFVNKEINKNLHCLIDIKDNLWN